MTEMKADLIIRGNAIFDGVADEPFAGFVAVNGNRIAAVCKDPAAVQVYAGPETRVYDAGDRLIMSGFVDGHDHLWWGAVADSDHMVDLTSSRSEEEALQMIKEYADSHPDEKRIRGFGWFPANWNDAPLPTKHSLDKVVPDRPAYMNCADAHTCWVNSKGLEEAGYTPDMEIKGGYIGLDENGEMNGLIYEPDAMIHAWEKLYDFPEHEIRDITKNFMKGLASSGVTSLSEMSADEYKDFYYDRYKVFKDMADNGEFTSRVHAYTALMGHTDFRDAQAWADEFSSNTFKVNGLKGFLDGVTSTHTGYMLEPYTDRPETSGEGVPLATRESLEASVIAGNAAGLPVRIHCIGDAAVRMALDAFEKSREVNGDHGLRNSIEHIETIDPADIRRFKELDVIASLQGEHLPLDNNEKLTRAGEERCRWAWPFRSILDSGATLAFGTDFPVVNYNQFPGIHAAVARKNYDGSQAGIDNGEHITLKEALLANTLGSAKVYGRDHELGTLETGKLADMIVVDRNLFEIPHDDILNAKVDITVMDGNVIYNRHDN